MTKKEKSIRHDGVKAVSEMFRVMDEKTSQRLLSELEARSPELAQKIRSGLFSFEDLLKASSKDFQVLFRAVPQKKWALAFRGLAPEVLDGFVSKLSKRTQTELIEEIQSLGPQRVSDVQAVRQEISEEARKLEKAGALQLPNRQSSDES